MTEDSCVGCDLGRRAFVRDAALAAAALGAMGLFGERADAMPVRVIHALAANGKEATYAIPAADGVNIDKKSDIILARVGRSLFAFDLSCPHQTTALRWNSSDKRFQCPKHKSQYSAEGVYIEGRATRSMDRHLIRRDCANVIVDLDKVFEEDQDGALWKTALVTV